MSIVGVGMRDKAWEEGWSTLGNFSETDIYSIFAKTKIAKQNKTTTTSNLMQ